MTKDRGNARTNPLEFYALDPNFLYGIIEDPYFDADDPQQLLNRYHALSALEILNDGENVELVQEGYVPDYLRELMDDSLFELLDGYINWEGLAESMTITRSVWSPLIRVPNFAATTVYHLMRNTFGNK